MENSWVSIIPPLLAIVLAATTRRIYLSLFLGIWSGWTLLAVSNPLLGLAQALEAFINVFANAENVKIISFCTLMGAFIAMLQASGGVQGFVQAVTSRNLVNNRRRSQIMASVIGIFIFIETNINSLIIGSLSRPFFDRFKVSREKLAYYCDSTSAPKNIMIPLNAWGAYVIGLLAQQGIEKPMVVLLSSAAFNFYAIAALVLVYFIAFSGFDFGPMKKAEIRAINEGKVHRDGAKPLIGDEISQLPTAETATPSAANLITPVVVLVVSMLIFMVMTGNGDITTGEGTTSVFWAILFTIFISAILYALRGHLSVKESVNLSFKGMGSMIPLIILIAMTFAIGDLSQELGTGEYVSQLAKEYVYPPLIPALLFVLSGFIAFSTGTSWGTFAIMIPLAIPLATGLDLNMALVIGSVLGGGIFGDHCSPLSDTTIVASMAAACDHIDHVNTQLPYALLGATVAVILYLVFGFALLS